MFAIRKYPPPPKKKRKPQKKEKKNFDSGCATVCVRLREGGGERERETESIEMPKT